VFFRVSFRSVFFFFFAHNILLFIYDTFHLNMDAIAHFGRRLQ